MNSKRIVHLVFVLSLILVSAFAAAPASAKAPTQFEIPVDWSQTYLETPCGFPIFDSSHGIQRSTYWYDENNVLTMGINFFYITGALEANGKSLEFSYNYGVHGRLETFPDYYTVWVGISPHIILPGAGAVVKSAGYFAYTYTLVGDDLVFKDVIKEVGIYYADWDAICEYLAPPAP